MVIFPDWTRLSPFFLMSTSLVQSSVRSSLGVVPQETTLFNAELGYNIQYGSIQDGQITATQVDVEQAAMLARLHERVLSFEHGYQTMVGEKGVLSLPPCPSRCGAP